MQLDDFVIRAPRISGSSSAMLAERQLSGSLKMYWVQNRWLNLAIRMLPVL